MVESETLSKVNEIISNANLELRSIEVTKDIPLELDPGNLLVSDCNELDKARFKNKRETDEYLKEIARDGVQAILNKMWDLPCETMDNKIYVVLPDPTTRLPREKRVPKPRPLTKWQEFAKEKGIKKKKKPNKVWDEVMQDWVPRYGFRKVQAEKNKDWVVEIPDQADPYEDQFEKKSKAKKENVARNEYMRLRNLARAKNIKVPTMGVTSVNMKKRGEMTHAISQARVSTASLGKFQASLPKEKPLALDTRGKKRKLPANDTSLKGLHNEKMAALDILGKMKKSEIDYETAVNKQIRMENIEMSHQGKKLSNTGRRSKHGGRQRGQSEHKARAKGSLTKSFGGPKKKSSAMGGATKPANKGAQTKASGDRGKPKMGRARSTFHSHTTKSSELFHCA